MSEEAEDVRSRIPASSVGPEAQTLYPGRAGLVGSRHEVDTPASSRDATALVWRYDRGPAARSVGDRHERRGVETNEELVTALRRAARDLAGRRSIRDLDQTLSDIVQAAVETVPHVEAGGISITQDGQVESRNPTGEVVAKLDQLQSELNEGPCITAVLEPPEDGIVISQDLGGPDSARWPAFAPQAVEAGYRAIMSTELSSHAGMRAALNLYAAEPDVFDLEARTTAALFGIQAAMLLYGSEQAGHLQTALHSRDLIGQAKGIIMERFRVRDDDAFEMLVRSSQDTNIKLVDVAGWLRDETNDRSHTTATEQEHRS